MKTNSRPVLSPLEQVALSKALNDKSVKISRKDCVPGVYALDFTVRVNGRMKVALDTTTKNCQLDIEALLLVTLAKLPELELKALIKQAIKVKPEALETFKGQLKTAMEQYAPYADTPRMGAVSATLDVEAVEVLPVEILKDQKQLELEKSVK